MTLEVSLSSGDARAEESFGAVNAFIYFNSTLRRVELLLAANTSISGYYESLVNYTEPHKPSPYWTKKRDNLLSFYGNPTQPAR